jgi:hypothetical protein
LEKKFRGTIGSGDMTANSEQTGMEDLSPLDLDLHTYIDNGESALLRHQIGIIASHFGDDISPSISHLSHTISTQNDMADNTER